MRPSRGSADAFAGALVGAAVVIGLAIAGAAGSTDEVVLVAVVTGAWAVAAVFVAVQRPNEPLWVWTLAVALAGAIAVLAPAAAPIVPFVAFAFRGRVARRPAAARASGGSSRPAPLSRSVLQSSRRTAIRGRARWSASRSCSHSAQCSRTCRRAGGRGEPQSVAVGGLGCRRGRRPRTGHRPARGAVGLAHPLQPTAVHRARPPARAHVREHCAECEHDRLADHRARAPAPRQLQHRSRQHAGRDEPPKLHRGSQAFGQRDHERKHDERHDRCGSGREGPQSPAKRRTARVHAHNGSFGRHRPLPRAP